MKIIECKSSLKFYIIQSFVEWFDNVLHTLGCIHKKNMLTVYRVHCTVYTHVAWTIFIWMWWTRYESAIITNEFISLWLIKCRQKIAYSIPITDSWHSHFPPYTIELWFYFLLLFIPLLFFFSIARCWLYTLLTHKRVPQHI